MSGDAKQNVALVAGALGITGRKLVRHLDSLERWDVVDLRQRIVFEQICCRIGWTRSPRGRFWKRSSISKTTIISDTVKAREFGFADVVDTTRMFTRIFAEFRRDRIIP